MSNPDYTHFVVSAALIMSGWEHLEDALDDRDNAEAITGKMAAVYTRRGLARTHLDPNDPAHWYRHGMTVAGDGSLLPAPQLSLF